MTRAICENIFIDEFKNNMNTFFYAPKEDINHRLCWRKKYSKNWRLNFRKFTDICKNNKINAKR